MKEKILTVALATAIGFAVYLIAKERPVHEYWITNEGVEVIR